MYLTEIEWAVLFLIFTVIINYLMFIKPLFNKANIYLESTMPISTESLNKLNTIVSIDNGRYLNRYLNQNDIEADDISKFDLLMISDYYNAKYNKKGIQLPYELVNI